MITRKEADKVGKIIAGISSDESLTKFKNLNSQDITSKGLNDIVTTVDVNIQQKLIEALLSEYPGSKFISVSCPPILSPENKLVAGC